MLERRVSPFDAKTPVNAPDRIKNIDVVEESRIHTSEPFFIGGVEILGTRPPKSPAPEYIQLSKAGFIALLGHGLAAYAGSQLDHAPAVVNQEAGSEKDGAKTEQVKEMLAGWAVEAEHNKEIREQLETERTVTIDHLINVYLDPSSPDYHSEAGPKIKDRPLPPIDSFVQLDAQNFGINFATNSSGTLPSVDEIHERIEVQKAKEMAQFDERLLRLLKDPQYTWTGNLETDLVTLRSAMFEGPNRFFSSENYGVTQYQKDSWRVSDQLTTGLVQCQVSRWTPILLENIYDHLGLDETPLLDLRVATWSDHVQTGIVHANGTTSSFAELALGKDPGEPATNAALSTAEMLPIEAHLALYLSESGATPEQTERMVKLLHIAKADSTRQKGQRTTEPGATGKDHTELLVKLAHSPLPDPDNGVHPLTSAGILTPEKSIAGTTESINDLGYLTPEKIRQFLKEDTKSAIENYLFSPENTDLGVYGNGEVFLVEIPSWTADPIFREYVIQQ